MGGQDYLSKGLTAMDKAYYQSLDSWGSIYHPTALSEDDSGAKTSLGPRELGSTVNPMQNQLIALQAKLREGASRMEIGFGGVGKGNSQMATPEAYGYEERQALRELAEYNEVKTSTHASFQLAGLAGFGENGFDNRRQHQIMEEVKKAVDFASQATTGGAVVVHTGEWARPMSEAPWSKEGGEFAKVLGREQPAYKGYPEESLRAGLPVVDGRTGEIIGGIRKDTEIFEPKWILAKDFEKEFPGKKLSHKDLDGNRRERYENDDYVDVDGNWLDPDKERDLFRRLPKFDATNTQFESEKLDWKGLVEKTDRYNERYHKNYRPEEMFARIQLENQALQARGSSLFHGQNYAELAKRRDKLKEALKVADEVYGKLPPDEQWRALRNSRERGLEAVAELLPPDTKDIRKAIQEQIDAEEQQMRHIHESSASADTQAATLLARRDHIETVEQYGLKKSGEALADLGIYAMKKSQAMKDAARARHANPDKYDNLYIAPENVFPEQYGSHPDELMNIVQAGRDQMVEKLVKEKHMSEDKAKELAKEHIKSTIDIGHLNMWKTHMARGEKETEEQFHKRFEDWAVKKVEEMHNKGMLGHFHLTDNLGFNDEHITPGQGNAPIRAFIRKLEELGKGKYNDFIAEIGSFNAGTILPDTWSYLGVRNFKGGGGRWGPSRFTDIHTRHFGGYAPPNYIVGAYVPSNEFTLWSQIPLE